MAALFGSETQPQSAQRMYNVRATKYEDSWHPDYSGRFVGLVPLRKDDRVLDLCCSTGLEAFLAAEIVGEKGGIVGVDVSSGMLEQLHERQKQEPELGRRIRYFHHDVTNLEGLPGDEVAQGSFDVIMCSCAFVLLDEPAKVVADWKEYLKPGGVMAIDVPHEWNLRSGYLLEQVARKMHVEYPSNRWWVKSRETFKEILERQGMSVENVVLLDRISGKGSTYHGIDDADAQYEDVVNSSLTQNVVSEDFKVRARPLFREEWERAAVDGEVENVDALYVYIAQKPE